MREKAIAWKLFLVLFPIVWVWGGTQQSLAQQRQQVGYSADEHPKVSCSQFMAPKRNVKGKMVGQEECLMQDHGIVEPNLKYHRVDMGITGTCRVGSLSRGAAELLHVGSGFYLYPVRKSPQPTFPRDPAV